MRVIYLPSIGHSRSGAPNSEQTLLCGGIIQSLIAQARQQTTLSSTPLVMGKCRALRLGFSITQVRPYLVMVGALTIPFSLLSQVFPALQGISVLQVVLNVHTTAKSENSSSVASLQTPSSGLSAYTQFVSAAATTNTVPCALIPATLHGALNMSHARHA